MITHVQFCSVTGYQQESPVPTIMMVVIAFGIFIFVLVFVCLAWRGQSQPNGYALHAFPPGTVVTVHPHSDPDLTALVPPLASPLTYKQLQVANGDGGVSKLLHRDQSSGIIHKPDDP